MIELMLRRFFISIEVLADVAQGVESYGWHALQSQSCPN